MGYRVDYQPEVRFSRQQPRRSRIVALTGGFFLAFLLLLNSIWPRGKEVLQGMLFSGDVAVTAAALEDMAQDLKTGVPFADALAGFCFSVVEGAGVVYG